MNEPNKLVYLPGKAFHFSLLCPFLSYEENKVLQIWHPVPYSQNFIFFITYDCVL